MNIGIPGMLGIVFVVLKLCGVIGWSWWWVTIPFWGVLALLIAFTLFALSMAGVSVLVRRMP